MENTTIEERRARLLDQLENPALTRGEIEQIKLKLELLASQE